MARGPQKKTGQELVRARRRRHRKRGRWRASTMGGASASPCGTPQEEARRRLGRAHPEEGHPPAVAAVLAARFQGHRRGKRCLRSGRRDNATAVPGPSVHREEVWRRVVERAREGQPSSQAPPLSRYQVTGSRIRCHAGISRTAACRLKLAVGDEAALGDDASADCGRGSLRDYGGGRTGW